MTAIADHLVILPILIPLAAAAVVLLVDDRSRSVKAAINVGSTLLALVVAVVLMRMADTSPDGAAAVMNYRLGDWPVPFGIVLVVDRLSAMMLVLTGMLALAALVYALARWHRDGAYFHALFQILLMGVNGAVLTGDLFNLFVFIELLLVASYGLVLHGSGIARVKAGLHYIAVNLAASLLFLVGVSLIYGVTGTLNMADLAQRIPALADADRALLETGAAVLGVAFLVKAGMWPLCFWLPAAYSVSAPPVAAFFAILSKVGVYVLLRLSLLFFATGSGQSAGFGSDWLLFGGMATIVYGSVGVLASQDVRRLAAYAVVVSTGTVMAAAGLEQPAVTGAALFYLFNSTLGIAALFMLVDLAERGRDPGADVLAVTMEAYGDEPETAEAVEEVGIAIPATMAILGLSFVLCGLHIAGLPPLSGFVAKFALMTTLINPAGLGVSAAPTPLAWALVVLLVLSGLFTLIAMTRAGIRIFWAVERTPPRVQLIEIAPVAVLLLACVTLTLMAGDGMRYAQATADDIRSAGPYVDRVFSPHARVPDGAAAP